MSTFTTPAASQPSAIDRARQEATQKGIDASIGRQRDWLDVGGASLTDTYFNLAGRQFGRLGIPVDPSFTIDEKTLEELGAGISPDQWIGFAGAGSRAEANVIRDELLQRQKARDVLRAAGWAGTAASATASITDPVALLAGAASGGIGWTGRIGGAVGRLAGLAEAGLINAAPFAALEAYRATQDPTVTRTDIARAAFSGFGMGVGGRAASRFGTAMQGLRDIHGVEMQVPVLVSNPAYVRMVQALSTGGGAAAGSLAADVAGGTPSHDAMYYALTSGVFAAGLSAMHGPQGMRQRQFETIREIQFDDVLTVAAERGVSPETIVGEKGGAYFKAELARWNTENTIRSKSGAPDPGIITPEQVADKPFIADDIPTVDEADTPTVSAAPAPVPADTAPAAQGGGAATPAAVIAGGKKPGDFIAQAIGVPMGRFVTNIKGRIVSAGRFSMGARVSASETPEIRDFGANLFPDAVPRSDGKGGFVPVFLDANTHVMARSRGFFAALDNAETGFYKQHAEAAAASGTKPLSLAEFQETTGRAVRRPVGTATDPAIEAYAKHVRGAFKDLLEHRQRHMEKGFLGIAESETYFTRLWSREKVKALDAQFDHVTVRGLIEQAINAAQPGIKAKTAEAYAEAILRAARHQDQNFELFRAEDTRHTLAERIRQVLPKPYSDSVVEDLVNTLVRPSNTSNVAAEGRARIDLDETYRASLTNKAGQAVDIGIEDLLENNVNAVAKRYGRRAYGRSATAELYRTLGKTSTGAPIENLEQALTVLRERAEAQGRSPDDPRLRDEMANIEVGLKMAEGIPLSPRTDASSLMHRLGQANYIRYMSNAATGIRNFMEISEAAHTLGWGNFLRSAPAFREIITMGREGGLDTPALRELYMLSGSGEHATRNQIAARFMSDGGGAQGGIDHILAAGTRLSGNVSLVTPFQVMMERWVTRMLLNKWGDIALNGKLPGKARYAEMGLSDAQASAIAAEIATNAVPGSGRTKIHDLRMELWDQQTAMDFTNAITLYSARLVMQPNQAALARWMTTDTGKLIMQFRPFTFRAWETKFLTGVSTAIDGGAVGTKNALESWLVQTITAGAGYTAITYMNAFGRPDREKFLKNRLAPAMVGKAAFAQASWSSFMPAAIDLAAEATTGNQVFSFARTTVQDNNPITGIPAVRWAGALWRSKNALSAPINSDYDFSKNDLSNIRDGAFIPNVYGLNQLFEQWKASLPRESQPRK